MADAPTPDMVMWWMSNHTCMPSDRASVERAYAEWLAGGRKDAPTPPSEMSLKALKARM